MPDPICRDYNATTPVAPEMLQAMLPRLRTGFGNPSSTHPLGRRAAQAEATARHQVAELIGAKQHEPVFAGCATKANNLAVLGVAHALGTGQGHLVVSSGQHPAVMAPALNPRDQGLVPTVLPGAGQGHGLPARQRGPGGHRRVRRGCRPGHGGSGASVGALVATGSNLH